MFISAVYGVLYRSVCVGTGSLCSPGCERGVCVAGVRGGGLRCWGIVCVCDQVSAQVVGVSVMVRLDSGNACVV